jgi:TonB family protein
MTFRKKLALAAILLLGACAEKPQVHLDPPPDAIMQRSRDLPVVWTYFGNVQTMLQYYPRAAWQAEEGGSVYAACAWDAAGRITDCRVLSEAPEGRGFGQATADMLKAVGQVKAKNRSQPIEPGDGLVINIEWHYGG